MVFDCGRLAFVSMKLAAAMALVGDDELLRVDNVVAQLCLFFYHQRDLCEEQGDVVGRVVWVGLGRVVAGSVGLVRRGGEGQAIIQSKVLRPFPVEIPLSIPQGTHQGRRQEHGYSDNAYNRSRS
jgi:hypothetical protein